MKKIDREVAKRRASIAKLGDVIDQKYRKFSVLISLSTWLVALLWVIPPVFGWSAFEIHISSLTCSIGWTQSESSNISYAVYLMVGSIITPFVVKTTLHVLLYQQTDDVVEEMQKTRRHNSVVRLARRVSRASRHSISARQSISSMSSVILRDLNNYLNQPVSSTMRQDKKIAKVMAVLGLVSILCWMPYTTYTLVLIHHQTSKPELAVLLSILPKICIVYNPIMTLVVQFSDEGRHIKLSTCCYRLCRFLRASAIEPLPQTPGIVVDDADNVSRKSLPTIQESSGESTIRASFSNKNSANVKYHKSRDGQKEDCKLNI